MSDEQDIQNFLNYNKDNITKGKRKNTTTNQLTKIPKKDYGDNMPTAQVFHKNVYYQADLLYMPVDNDVKYVLVCVDMFDGSMDAEPLKNRAPSDIVDAFDKIFKRKYLKYPTFITFDQGAEFKTLVKTYFVKHGTNVNYALAGRHRQLANVERTNQKITDKIFSFLNEKDGVQGHENKKWLHLLPSVVKILNDEKKIPMTKEIHDLPLITKDNGDMLEIGQPVRLQLEKPKNYVTDASLQGGFRTGDKRWTNDTYKITDLLLKPGFPPMYLTDSNDNVARTKNQLSVVKNNEIEQNAKYAGGDENLDRVIKEILDFRRITRGGKSFQEYKIKWVGYNEPEWVSTNLFNRTTDLKNMRKKFNDTLK